MITKNEFTNNLPKSISKREKEALWVLFKSGYGFEFSLDRYNIKPMSVGDKFKEHKPQVKHTPFSISLNKEYQK